jgi:hypothetical protein
MGLFCLFLDDWEECVVLCSDSVLFGLVITLETARFLGLGMCLCTQNQSSVLEQRFLPSSLQANHRSYPLLSCSNFSQFNHPLSWEAQTCRSFSSCRDTKICHLLGKGSGGKFGAHDSGWERGGFDAGSVRSSYCRGSTNQLAILMQTWLDSWMFTIRTWSRLLWCLCGWRGYYYKEFLLWSFESLLLSCLQYP